MLTSQIWLVASLLLNLLLLTILWRGWGWRQQTLSMLHALLKMIKVNSAMIRRVKYEPWCDEHVTAAEDAVDRQFSIVYGFLNPHEQIVILDDPEPAPVPLEPGGDDDSFGPAAS